MFAPDAASDVHRFIARARRLDPAALVRLRPGADDTIELWTVLPFGVLACASAPGSIDGDATVRAADLETVVSDGEMPNRVDRQWRGALPADTGVVLDELSAEECHRIGESAGQTLRQARGKGVGDRRLRDVLLDHVALHISVESGEYEIRLRLVLGLLRMGFAPAGPVRIRLTAGRLGLEAVGGTVWNPAPGLTIL